MKSFRVFLALGSCNWLITGAAASEVGSRDSGWGERRLNYGWPRVVVGTPRSSRRVGINRRPAAVLGLEAALVSGAAASFPPAVPLELPFFIYPEQNSSQPQSSCFQIKCHLSLLSYRAAFFPELA